jgi:uncharacterized protein (DUF302 family)
MNGETLGITVRLGAIAFDEALARTIAALKAEGFGVITEIDVQETMRQKLGVEVRPYKILGACNPPIAHEALAADPMIGLLLPCNVIVFEGARGGVTVSIANPRKMFELVEAPGVGGMVETVYGKLSRAAAAIQSSVVGSVGGT